MKLHTLLVGLTASFALASFAGCGDGSSGSSGSAGASGASGASGAAGSTGNNPAAPKLGTQIDRFGRPAINTALNHTFDPDATSKDKAKDAWNANSDTVEWATYIPEIEKNLAILDGIDTVCGNQLLADMTKTDATRYKMLATVLADDRLYLNSASATCTTYLGVEANAVGVTNTDCGGRTLTYDVIDQSYTVLAAGKLDGSIGDTIGKGPAASGADAFPYLTAPQ